MNRSEISKRYGIDVPRKFDQGIFEVISTGCDLGYFTKADLEFLISEDCNLIRATNLIIRRRREAADK